MQPEEVLQNRYRLVRRLGSGGMSSVWLAEDMQLHRSVALKILRPDLDEASFAQRLEREASLLARIENPHIIPIYESGTLLSGEPYLVMKYIEGRTLDKVGLMSVEETRQIFAQILEGVAAAHEAGIVHRDIKPSNVIIDDSGNAFLFDFGVARDEKAQDSLTQTGTVIGTAHYLSPEQAHGEPATVQSDLYSLGIMLYESLTNHQPWPGENSIAQAVQQALEPAEPPSFYRKEIDPRLDKTVLRSIAYKPELRFSSAREFRDALLDRSPLSKKRGKYLLLLLPLLLLGAWFFWQSEQTKVPDLVGMSLLEARKELSENDLRWHTRNIYSGLPQGKIVRTTPDAGTSAQNGSIVVLWVSRGPQLFAIPELSGKPIALAESLLSEIGFESERQGMFSDFPKGSVVRSEPPAGTRMRLGSAVMLWVSRGPAPTRAPDCVGQTEAECQSLATEAGVLLRVSRWSSAAPPGEIVEQYPVAGEITDTLQIYVSDGSEIIEVPDVVGEKQGAARRELSALGLSVIISQEETDDDALRNTVIRQSPQAGAELSLGDTVTLFIGKATLSDKTR